jgi:hypothetical protein
MTRNLTVTYSSPGTQALEESLKGSLVVFKSFRSFGGIEDSSSLHHPKMINTKSLKRSRSSMSGFDMESLMRASEEVEESNLFPSIAWPSCDDDHDDDDDTEKYGTSGLYNKVLYDNAPKAKDGVEV